jgi:hypothetical protein
VELADLLDVIVGYQGASEFGNGHLFDASELYEALSIAYGGSDADGDGVDDVDQVFEAHGFFADSDGSRSRGPRERYGLTSHPAFGEFVARPLRRDLPPPEAATITIESGGIVTQVLVHTSFAPPNEARSSGYIVNVGPDGTLQIAAPPRAYEAEITLTAIASGYDPAIVLRVTNEELWELFDAQAPGETLGTIAVDLVPADHDGAAGAASEERPDTAVAAAGGGGIPGGRLTLIAGAALLVLLAGGAFPFILRATREKPPPLEDELAARRNRRPRDRDAA